MAALRPATPAPTMTTSACRMTRDPCDPGSAPVVDRDRGAELRSHDLPVAVGFATDHDDVDRILREHVDRLVGLRFQPCCERLHAEGGVRVDVVLDELHV